MPVAGDFTIIVKTPDAGKRLDILIASQFNMCSRSRVADLILSKKIRVNGALKKPGYRIKTGDKIRGSIPPPGAVSLVPEPIEIDIIYEDPDILLVNKPPGLVVHPAAGHYSGTLVNALLYHRPGICNFGGEFRPGIIHRLDKDTSGVLVVAKNSEAHYHLTSQFKSRKVQKTYLALMYGEMSAETGVISLPIGRHPIDRKRMSTISRKGREAESHWRVRKRFGGVTLVEWNLKTGRTHQIRVHCAAINHPIVGDPVYCPRRLLKNITKHFPSISPDIADVVQSAKRQMLHAWRLGFFHPKSTEFVSFEAPIPSDMADQIKCLQKMGRPE
jgi:23S rRNA pseudouridine1911/1915/1917 synthase